MKVGGTITQRNGEIVGYADSGGSAARYFYNAQESERDNENITVEVKFMENQKTQQKIHLYSEGKNYKLYQGSMLDMLNVIEPDSIDSIVTDPPYELNFMNKGWDNSGIAFQKETWEKCYTALKPGGYLLAFGGSRTFHRIAVAIEDAGFEIRDTIMWLYGSGFPKSMNLGKAVESKLVNGSANTQDWKNLKGTKVETGDWGLNANAFEYGARPSDYSEDGHMRVDKVDYQTEEGKQWDGWGTSLKPAYEPVIVARKPCEGSCVDNVMKYGVGGINIDGCRVETNEDIKIHNYTQNSGIYGKYDSKIEEHSTNQGRFPSNVILTYDESDKDEVCGGMPIENYESANRYFYCAKASQKDRDEGLEDFELQRKAGYGYDRGYMNAGEGMFKDRQTAKRNTHPTVKPCELMQYLVRLVTPKGGTVLDPFNGSGSTGKATMFENKDRNADYKYIGIELTSEYLPISQARIEYAINYVDTVSEKPMSEEKKKMIKNQMSLFDI